MADIKITDLTAAQAATANDLFEIAQPSGNDFVSLKLTAAQLATLIAAVQTYSGLTTTAQSLVGAINELCGTKLTDTLTAGSTTLTISDNAILTTSVVDIYVDTWGVSPSDVHVAAGSITLTFPVQTGDVGVLVIVR